MEHFVLGAVTHFLYQKQGMFLKCLPGMSAISKFE